MNFVMAAQLFACEDIPNLCSVGTTNSIVQKQMGNSTYVKQLPFTSTETDCINNGSCAFAGFVPTFQIPTKRLFVVL